MAIRRILLHDGGNDLELTIIRQRELAQQTCQHSETQSPDIARVSILSSGHALGGHVQHSANKRGAKIELVVVHEGGFIVVTIVTVGATHSRLPCSPSRIETCIGGH